MERIEPKVIPTGENYQVLRLCGLAYCPRWHYAKGYCKSHYEDVRAGRELTPILDRSLFPTRGCGFSGCDRQALTKTGTDLCQGHWNQEYAGEELRPLLWKKGDGYNEDRTRRVCKKCGEDKPVEDFYLRNQQMGYTARTTKCKECFKAEVRARKKARDEGM